MPPSSRSAGGTDGFAGSQASADAAAGVVRTHRLNPVRAGTLGALREGRPRLSPTCDLGSGSHRVEQHVPTARATPLSRTSARKPVPPDVFRHLRPRVSGPSSAGTPVGPTRGVDMSGIDKMKNKAEELSGKGKESVGEATGDRDLQAEGKADQASGSLKQAGEKVKDVFK